MTKRFWLPNSMSPCPCCSLWGLYFVAKRMFWPCLWQTVMQKFSFAVLYWERADLWQKRRAERRAEGRAGPLQKDSLSFTSQYLLRKKANVLNQSLTYMPAPFQMPCIHGQGNKTSKNQAELRWRLSGETSKKRKKNKECWAEGTVYWLFLLPALPL